MSARLAAQAPPAPAVPHYWTPGCALKEVLGRTVGVKMDLFSERQVRESSDVPVIWHRSRRSLEPLNGYLIFSELPYRKIALRVKRSGIFTKGQDEQDRD